jgi:hypothetical protein
VVCHAQKDKAIDSDNDGLTDAEEIKLGTNPFDSDSDDDGIPYVGLRPPLAPFSFINTR